MLINSGIDVRDGVSVETILFDRRRNTDDRHPRKSEPGNGGVRLYLETLTHRIFVGPEAFRRGLVDDRDFLLADYILVIKKSSPHERSLHCLEIVRAHGDDCGGKFFNRTSLDHKNNWGPSRPQG